MANEKVSKTIDADLSQWLREDDIPVRIREMFMCHNLEQNRLGFNTPLNELIIMADSADPRERKQGEAGVDRVKAVLLNLMRLESGLDATNKPVSEWPKAELVGNVRNVKSWGNPTTTSTAKPKDPRRGKPPVSPEPGWMYRMVDLNIKFVVKHLKWPGDQKPVQSRKDTASEALAGLVPQQQATA